MTQKCHFLVVAAASRGARLFIKKALLQGHDVTALCRAKDDQSAQDRMDALLGETILTNGGVVNSSKPGVLTASCLNILDHNTYTSILLNNPSIDRVCCFVGVTDIRQMFSTKTKLYTQTMRAIVEGMRNSRWVEFYYHGSSGTEGKPGKNTPKLPDNFKPLWLMKLGLLIPAAKDCFESEGVLASAKGEGLKFVVFRPAWLNSKPAQRNIGYCFDNTGLGNKELPIEETTTTISREDVAEEILRVATLPSDERCRWFGHGVYLVDKKR